MIQRRNSIFYRLTLSFICLGLVPLLIAGTVLFYRFRGNMEQVILDDMSRMVSYAAHNAQEMVEESSGLTKRMYDIYTEDGRLLYQLIKDKTMPDREKRTQMALFLSEMLEGDSRIRTAYFADKDGRIYYATRNTQKVLDEDAFRQWISQEGYSGENFAVLPTHVDGYFPDSRNQVITFRRSYQDLTSFRTIGISLGNLYLDLDLGKLSAVLQDMSMGVNETFSIIDQNGICIYSMDGSGIGKRMESLVPYLPSMTEARGSLADRRQYVVYDRLESCGWNVAAQAGKDSVMSSLDSTRQYVMVFLSGAFLVLLCLYSYFVKRIRRPVELLEQGMMEIQTGNLGSRIDVGGREDEIGVLAAGLNNMAQELEAYIKKVYVAEIRQRDAQLDALKSQIKPHYLYNTLEVIRMTALEHEDKETARMVESLSRQLKYLIGCNSDMVPLKKEIENIREYFYIMRIRYENRIQLEVSVDEDVMEASIIKLSLQPIVENAVRHGLRPKKGSGTVRIEAHRREGSLEVTVMDDGVGMTEEILAALKAGLDQEEMGVQTDEGWEHVGIKNAYERIRKIFGPDYGLEIMSTEGTGTVAVYCLPLILEGAEEGGAKREADEMPPGMDGMHPEQNKTPPSSDS